MMHICVTQNAPLNWLVWAVFVCLCPKSAAFAWTDSYVYYRRHIEFCVILNLWLIFHFCYLKNNLLLNSPSFSEGLIFVFPRYRGGREHLLFVINILTGELYCRLTSCFCSPSGYFSMFFLIKESWGCGRVMGGSKSISVYLINLLCLILDQITYHYS